MKNRPPSYFEKEVRLKTHEQMMDKLKERTGKVSSGDPTNRAEEEALLPHQGRQEAVNESPRPPKEGSIPSGPLTSPLDWPISGSRPPVTVYSKCRRYAIRIEGEPRIYIAFYKNGDIFNVIPPGGHLDSYRDAQQRCLEHLEKK